MQCVESFPPLPEVDYTAYYEESIVYLYFHLTRKQDKTMTIDIAHRLHHVLDMMKGKSKGEADVDMVLSHYHSLLLRLIRHTRSMVSNKYGCGKGENELTYMMLYIWYLHFPDVAIQEAKACFTTYGSWRDFPYLCNYIFQHTNNKFHSFIERCIDMANTQLAADLETWKFSIHCFSRDHISNIAKWIPREKKQFDWLHHRCVLDWTKRKFPYILDTALMDESYEKALRKCSRYYRKAFTTLNKALDTTQIKQCAGNRGAIHPDTVSPITAMKQRRTLTRESDSERKERKERKELLDHTGHTVFHGTRDVLPLSYFIKEAYVLSGQEEREGSERKERKERKEREEREESSQSVAQQCPSTPSEPQKTFQGFCPANFLTKTSQENPKGRRGTAGETGFPASISIERLNQEWQHYSSTISNDGFHRMLPMIDVSWSMYENKGTSYYSAIGLAILISERSSYSNRILAYGNTPEWIIFDPDMTFFEKVSLLQHSIRSIQFGKSYLEKALVLVHKALDESQGESQGESSQGRKVKYPILVVISDSFAGVAEYDMPIQQRMIYWNVSTHRNTELPCAYNQRNCILLSGINGGLLSNFRLLKRHTKNRAYSPYSFIKALLSGH